MHRSWYVSAAPGARALIRFALGVVVVFLLMDFIFRAIGSADVGIGHIVYTVGGALAEPFYGVLAPTQNGDHLWVWAYLIAAAVYALAGAAVEWLIGRFWVETIPRPL